MRSEMNFTPGKTKCSDCGQPIQVNQKFSYAADSFTHIECPKSNVRSEIDYILKSNAAVQVLYDKDSLEDYPKLVDNLLALFEKMCNEVSFDRLADELVEKKYQLRVEHNHGTMQWFAYYAGKDQRRLFDDDGDWDTAASTPTQALQALKTKLGE